VRERSEPDPGLLVHRRVGHAGSCLS
jgi:hypothetical protein